MTQAVAVATPAVAGMQQPVPAGYTPTTAPRCKHKWHPIQTVSQLSFKGGYSNRATEPVQTKDVSLPDGTPMTLVHVAKKVSWICRIVGAHPYLKRAGAILDDIRAMYFAAVSDLDDTRGKDTPDVDTTDPMAALDAPDEEEPAATYPKGRKRKNKNNSDLGTPRTRRPTKVARRNHVMTLTVPQFSKSAQPRNTHTVQIHVAVTGDQGKGEIWLGQQYIPWLLSYLADEVNTCGVELFESVSTGEGSSTIADGSQATELDDANESQATVSSSQSTIAGRPSGDPPENCGVPGVHLRLVPAAGNLDEYEALFVNGMLKGQRVTSKVSTMSQDKWDKLQACASEWRCPGPDINSKDVKREHKVSAVLKLLELTMAAKQAQAERLSDNTPP